MSEVAEGRQRGAGSLLVLVFLACLPILATPGYFSHDEWQRVDVVRHSGLWGYIREYAPLRAGPDFGFPVRPIGFVQQGISAVFMDRSPLLVHALDVAVHAIAALLLWSLLRQLRMPSRQAWLSAAIFAAAPLAMFAVGWVGASFDRWYVLFSMIAAMGVARIADAGVRPGAFALVLIAGACAMLSKETAAVLPGALLLLLAAMHWFGGGVRHWKPAFAAVALSCVPVAGYLLVRLPAIVATLHGEAVAAYSPSPAYLPYNAVAYLLQPWLPHAAEMVSFVFLPKWEWPFAALFAGGMLVAIAMRFGWKGLLLFLAGFFVFLLPVLTLPTPGAHYLYGSGIAFAVALAAVLSPAAGDPGTRWFAPAPWKAIALVLFAYLGLRSFYLQNNIYVVGRCQSEFLASFEPQAAAAHARGATRMRVQPMPGAKDYVAVRAVFGRDRYRDDGPMPTVVGGGEPAAPGDALFLMGTDCRVVAQ